MRQETLAGSMACVVRQFSRIGIVRQTLDRPSLKPYVNRAFYAAWRFVRGGYFEADLNGVKILFHDPGGPETYWTSFFTRLFYEHSVVMHLKKIANKYDSATFLDVGAHYGYFTVYMSKLVGPLGKVYSFEPNSEYFRVLGTNVRLNRLQNVVLHRLALSDKRGKAVLETSQRFKSRGLPLARRKMRPKECLNSPSHEQVATVPFDELAQPAGISPEIVKIDVHGAEGNVVSGMKRALKDRIDHLYCELHGEMCDGYSARDVVDTLQDAGMEIFEFRGFRRQKGILTEIPDDLFAAPDNRMIYARK